MPKKPKVSFDVPPAAAIRRVQTELGLAEGGRLTYWADHGISQRTLEQQGVGWDRTTNRYVIPYKDATGQVVAIRGLEPSDRHDVDGRKWRWMPGSAVRLYGLDTVHTKQAVLLCEGESDTLLARQCGLNAVGLAGVGNFRPDDASDIANIAYGNPVYVCVDADKAGAQALPKIRDRLRAEGMEVREVLLPAGQDVCEYVLENGRDRFVELVSNSKSTMEGYELVKGEEVLWPTFPWEAMLTGNPHSFIERYWSWCRGSCGSPHEFLFWCGMACLAAVARRRVVFRAGTTAYLTPNLYVMLIGGSGVGFKTAALSFPRLLLDRLTARNVWDPDTKSRHPAWILPNETTPEALMDILDDTPFGLFVWHEMGGAMDARRSKKYMAGFHSLLTEIYDTPQAVSRATKTSGVNVHFPSLSILGGMQPEFLDDAVESQEWYSGFLPRFVLTRAGRTNVAGLYQIEPQPPDNVWTEWLVDWLQNFVEGYPVHDNAEPVLVSSWATEKTRQMWRAWIHDNRSRIEHESDPIVQSFLQRQEGHAAKLATLWQISETMNATITTDILARTLALIQYHRELVEIVCYHRTDSRFHSLVKRTVKILQANGGSLTRGAILKRMKCKARELDEVMEHLEETGELKKRRLEVVGEGRHFARGVGHYTFKVEDWKEDEDEKEATGGQPKGGDDDE